MEKIEITVYGDTYPLKSPSPELTKKAAGLVDSEMRLFAEVAPSFEPAKLAVLSAVRLAEKQIELEGELAALQQKIAGLNSLMDESLQ
ncbi:MAG: cell division protein ZapA [Candidatus Chlorobium antarcticum]|jgi:cell division protein ZapA|nr:cell division protein ZapA [Candidatus Chlorobium antarcticum]